MVLRQRRSWSTKEPGTQADDSAATSLQYDRTCRIVLVLRNGQFPSTMERNDSVQKPECRARSNIRSDAGREESRSLTLFPCIKATVPNKGGKMGTRTRSSHFHMLIQMPYYLTDRRNVLFHSRGTARNQQLGEVR